jgi:hypothetical protein
MLGTRTQTPELPSSSWRQTAARLADRQRLWTGESGATLTGREVADHLAKARDYLAKRCWDPRTGHGIYGALMDTSPSVDTRYAASRLLDLILSVRANAPRADHEAWEARASRTWREVADLLTAAAQFAREHGPKGGA